MYIYLGRMGFWEEGLTRQFIWNWVGEDLYSCTFDDEMDIWVDGVRMYWEGGRKLAGAAH